MELYQRAVQLIPGGTQLLSRRPSQFAYGVSPIYAQRAKGARFWDVDGNEYIAWLSDIGAIILGYADPAVDEAVHAQIDKGVTYGINHELELELAEQLISLVPCAEMVRYAKGGGEACMIAVRIARGVTDGVRGMLVECKLDPSWQGPACVTKKEGRIEHDQHGVARAMALRVIKALQADGVERIDVMAYGTEVDFCEELGFRRSPGIVSLQMAPAETVVSEVAEAAASL